MTRGRQIDKQRLHFRRFELKYILPNSIADVIISSLKDNMVKDNHVVIDDYYSVNSIYLDSPNLKCFEEKLAGINERKKYRLRWYSEYTPSKTSPFLEIKRKYESVIVKDRLPISSGDALDTQFLLSLRNNQTKSFINELIFQTGWHTLLDTTILIDGHSQNTLSLWIVFITLTYTENICYNKP